VFAGATKMDKRIPLRCEDTKMLSDRLERWRWLGLTPKTPAKRSASVI
jgi:hypothetical protein